MYKNSTTKLICVFLLLVFLSLSTSISFASSELVIESNNISTAIGKTTLEIVNNTVCNINLNDIGKFEKKISHFDAENKSATLSLTLTNLKQIEESQLPVEIFLVIDNSTSMKSDITYTKTRKQVVIDSANALVDKLFDTNSNAKVGIVSFSSLTSNIGTLNDAQLILGLNNSKTEVKNAITKVSNSETGPLTNIEAGITLASQNYSDDVTTKKYIVLLTDGVPNATLNGTFATYSGIVATRTKAKLKEIEESGISIIGAMIGLDGEKIETQSKKTYKALAEEVFGTVENPTITEYYYISDDITQIETTIIEYIFKNVVSIKDNTLKNIILKDYFPQEIIDNFNFEYVASPNIGNVSTEISKEDNSITWTIETLKENELSILSYKLTLKDDYNKEIVDKVLPTNKKVDITVENSTTLIEETSNDSPTVKVLYVEPEKEPEIENEIIIPDNTIAPEVIPQTGTNNIVSIFITVSIICTFITIIRFYLLKIN